MGAWERAVNSIAKGGSFNFTSLRRENPKLLMDFNLGGVAPAVHCMNLTAAGIPQGQILAKGGAFLHFLSEAGAVASCHAFFERKKKKGGKKKKFPKKVFLLGIGSPWATGHVS